MSVRETSRIVTVGDRMWKICKFDALTGSYIATKLVSRLSNVAIGVISGELKDESVIAVAIVNQVGSLSKQEFMEIEAESLHVVKEIKTVGDKDIEQPVYLQDGRWGVEGLEVDALFITALVGHVLLFNLTSFFDANALKELKNSFTGLIPFGATT